jgi:ribosomal protein S18 acetylase RimI-like enzyme
MFVSHEHRAYEKSTNTQQDQKLSHQLLQEVFVYCEQNNILSLNLQTSNIHAVRFYEKNGFILLDKIPNSE